MKLRIKLPGGTFKIKTHRELRNRERNGVIPMKKFGPLYFVWWPNKHKP